MLCRLYSGEKELRNSEIPRKTKAAGHEQEKTSVPASCGAEVL